MKRLSYGEVLAILNEAVAERGADWIYPNANDCPTCNSGLFELCDWHCAEGCRYFTPDNEPCCIVGYFIDKVVDTSQLDTTIFEGERATAVLDKLEMWEELSLDGRTRELLQIAQERQDNDVSWGKAVAIASAQTP